jgi:type VI secretion system secreted protein VgrG
MFDDKAQSELIRMHAEKDHNVTVKNTQTYTIGEVFTTPQGSPSRSTTLKNGDDQLTLDMGDRNITLSMGNQTTTLNMGQQTTTTMQGITLTVCYGVSMIEISPESITLSSPEINLMGETAVNIIAPDVNIGLILNTPELNAGAATISGIPL